MACFERLPKELIHYICTHCDIEHVQNLRLACKWLAASARASVFRNGMICVLDLFEDRSNHHWWLRVSTTTSNEPQTNLPQGLERAKLYVYNHFLFDHLRKWRYSKVAAHIEIRDRIHSALSKVREIAVIKEFHPNESYPGEFNRCIIAILSSTKDVQTLRFAPYPLIEYSPWAVAWSSELQFPKLHTLLAHNLSVYTLGTEKYGSLEFAVNCARKLRHLDLSWKRRSEGEEPYLSGLAAVSKAVWSLTALQTLRFQVYGDTTPLHPPVI